VTYFLTIFAGTGNISLATLPVIAEVAKEQGIKPCRPLYRSGFCTDCDYGVSNLRSRGLHVFRHGRSWHQLHSPAVVVIPSTLLAVLVMSFLITALFNSNCLTTRFIVSVWKKAWLNCAVKDKLKSKLARKPPFGCSCWAWFA
jgi:anaerobic C4-dicarboxylate transporter DcuA